MKTIKVLNFIVPLLLLSSANAIAEGPIERGFKAFDGKLDEWLEKINKPGDDPGKLLGKWRMIKTDSRPVYDIEFKKGQYTFGPETVRAKYKSGNGYVDIFVQTADGTEMPLSRHFINANGTVTYKAGGIGEDVTLIRR